MFPEIPKLTLNRGRLPPCTAGQQRRLERCMQKVKARGSPVNPYAVCQKALGCRRRR